MIILGVIGLLVLGPEELPAMARKFAKFVNELKKVKDEILKPLTEINDSTNTMIQESRQSMHKELIELVNMRNKLEQEISKRQNAAVPTSVPQPQPLAQPAPQAETTQPTAQPTPQTPAQTLTTENKTPDGKS